MPVAPEQGGRSLSNSPGCSLRWLLSFWRRNLVGGFSAVVPVSRLHESLEERKKFGHHLADATVLISRVPLHWDIQIYL